MAPNKKRVELEVLQVTTAAQSMQSGPAGYVIILMEKEGTTALPVFVDPGVAHSIFVALHRQEIPRPLTHDLLKNVMQTFGISLREVIIHDLKDSVFYAVLVCECRGQVFTIDSRPSDAIALALRFHAPIYTYEHILEKAGFVVEEPSEKQTSKTKGKVQSARTTEKNPKTKPATTTTLKGKKLENLTSDDIKDLPSEELQKLLISAVEKEMYEVAALIRDELQRRGHLPSS